MEVERAPDTVPEAGFAFAIHLGGNLLKTWECYPLADEQSCLRIRVCGSGLYGHPHGRCTSLRHLSLASNNFVSVSLDIILQSEIHPAFRDPNCIQNPCQCCCNTIVGIVRVSCFSIQDAYVPGWGIV